MATKVYESVELELQDGRKVTIRPLPIKQLRKFMEVIDKLGSTEEETENLDVLVDATRIALEKQIEELKDDPDLIEDLVDMPTIWKIVEVAGGIKMADPNQLAEAASQVMLDKVGKN